MLKFDAFSMSNSFMFQRSLMLANINHLTPSNTKNGIVENDSFPPVRNAHILNHLNTRCLCSDHSFFFAGEIIYGIGI